MFQFDGDILLPLVAFAIPIVAITGGIVLGVVRALGRQRALEMAQRERIAAIERGIDPAKLPPIDLGQHQDSVFDFVDRQNSPMRRAQGLLIGGLVTLFAGVGISVFLGLMLHSHEGDDHNAWAVGLIPSFVGVALLLSAWLVWPKEASGPRNS
jgi:hypothetical protein